MKVVSRHEVKKEITAATVARLPDRARPDNKAAPHTSPEDDDQGAQGKGLGKGVRGMGGRARLTEGCHDHM